MTLLEKTITCCTIRAHLIVLDAQLKSTETYKFSGIEESNKLKRTIRSLEEMLIKIQE